MQDWMKRKAKEWPVQSSAIAVFHSSLHGELSVCTVNESQLQPKAGCF